MVDELIPGVLGVGHVQAVLSRLLRENVPIRNLTVILESLADAATESKDPQVLAEKVRAKVARTIVDPAARLGRHAARRDHRAAARKGARRRRGGRRGTPRAPCGLSLTIRRRHRQRALGDGGARAATPFSSRARRSRPFLAEAVTSVIPGAVVLSYQETSPGQEGRDRQPNHRSGLIPEPDACD